MRQLVRSARYPRDLRLGRRSLTLGVAASFVVVLMLRPELAKAQQTAIQPTFDPRQTEKTLDALQAEQRRTAGTTLRMPRTAPTPASGDSKPLFKLLKVTVAGAHAVPADVVEAAYRPYLGKNVSQADLAAMAGAISDAYRAAGYHLSRAIVPPQDIKAGGVNVTVIEGAITDILVKGDGAEQFGVASLLEVIRTEKPSRLRTVERQLMLANDRPGVRVVDTSLEEIGTTTGNFRLTVDVKTWRIYTSFALDNLGSSSVGPWQSYGTVAYNSLVAPGDTLALNLATTPFGLRELALGRMSYDVPVGNDGLRVGASALYSEVRPGDDRRLFDTLTRTESLELRSSIVALQSQKSSLTLTVAAGLSNISESDVFGPIYRDQVRTLSLTSDYQIRDDFGGANYLTFVLKQGLDVFGATHQGDAFVSRDGASGEFTLFDIWYTRYQSLGSVWSLKFAAVAQLSSDPLLTSQQFYLGGASFGRGYDSAQISGDNAVAGSVELRYDQKLNFQYLTGYQVYGFTEGGTVWNAGSSYNDGRSLASVGLGARFFLGGDLQAGVAVAVPLSYRSPTNENRNPTMLFSLSNSLKLCPERAQMRCL